MVTKATRDVVDLSIREITGGLKVSGDSGPNFRIDGVPIGATIPANGNFINITATDLTATGVVDMTGATLVGFNSIVPVGGIIMFNGTFASIPANWQLCDGTNGTPNLTDRFVYGTNTEGQLLDAGGQADAIIPDHTHTITDPGHTHIVFGSLNDGSAKNTFDEGNNTNLQNNTSASSTTGITINNTGESVTDKNLPPYIKLAFIQRMT